jgi:hypothetical protein
MVVAMVALSVALSSSAGANPVTGVASLIKGSQIAKNAITTKHVKNRSLLAKDFKAGQLPRGPAGPAGAAGAPGAQGPPGPAGAFRAYTNVKVDQAQQPTFNRNKGFSNVRSPDVGVYCLIAPGIEPSSVPHFAGQWTDGTQYVDDVVAADGGGQQCNSNEFQVNTLANDGNYTTLVEFWVAIP